MSSVPLSVARVSTQLQGQLLLGTLQSGQVNLLKVQQQLSTGQRLSRASEDTGSALGIVSLKRQLADNAQYAKNLDFADGFLGQVDSTLGDVTDVVNEAARIASSQIAATSDERFAQAAGIDALLSQVLNLANTRYRGQAIFGGQNGISDPFSAVGGGYLYNGTTTGQGILSPSGQSLEYTLSGDQPFGAVSSQVVGYRTLTPSLTSTTRLLDLNGARGQGISAGPLDLTIGATTVSVDLSTAATVGDVVTTINAALTANGSNATITLSGGTLMVNGDTTSNIAFADSGSGTTAADLGITGLYPATTNIAGLPLAPRITATTTIASLNNGAGIDPAGIILTNGAASATLPLAGLTTVEDLLNAINGSGTHVKAEINSAGTGINLFNPLSGTQLRIGENGGTTADDLGIRSLNPATNLADFNAGTGVTPIANTLATPTGQITVTTTAGSTFNVPLNGITSPSGLIAAINAATGNSTVTAALNATGNGITLTDTSGGPGNLSVARGPNFIDNSATLGILGTGTGGTLTGSNITLPTDDFRITRKDGTTFTVSLKGAVTVQDVLNKINNADGNTAVGTKVTASLNPTGNGIQLSDASTGSGALAVTALNASAAAEQLGILKTAPGATPGLITGDDHNPLQPQGLFSTLTMLRDALLANDTRAITRAGELLATDGARVIKANAVVGAREQDIVARRSGATDEENQLKQALSLLNDTDFTQAATLFQQLSTAYSAGLQVAQKTNNISLLDFLG